MECIEFLLKLANGLSGLDVCPHHADSIIVPIVDSIIMPVPDVVLLVPVALSGS